MSPSPGERRPHLLGIDDGPFDKRRDVSAPFVGVMMEGHDLVEAVATTRFAVDGAEVTEFLAEWIAARRFASALHGIVLGGISIAGLAIVDIARLAARTGLGVLVANRQEPRNDRLEHALRAAGLDDRIPLVGATPEAWCVESGLWIAHAGIDRERARALVLGARHKSQLPEPLRLAHLIAAALVTGESRGRP